MQSSRFVWLLLLLFLPACYLFAQENSAVSQQDEGTPLESWLPSDKQFDIQQGQQDIIQCRDVVELCFRAGWLEVKDTPNDSGRFEEWLFRATFSGEENGGFKRKGKRKIVNPKVPDNLFNGSSTHIVEVLGEMCFQGREAIFSSAGHEKDGRRKKDPIPHFGLRIRNPCFINRDRRVLRYDSTQQCRWDRSGKRRACLTFDAEYKLN